jgi:2-hydroxy-6-oxonona-2,4-dienedioate hydrolase
MRLVDWHERFRARIEAPVRSEFVDTSLGSSHVLIMGPEDGPPLICLHAMRTGSAHLLSELQPLASRFRLLAPDLPGQSVLGPPFRVSWSDNTLADWLVEVMSQLGIGNAPLLGISWGGFMARLAASAYPDRFSALVLIVPAGIVNGSHWRGLAQMAFPLLRYRMRPSQANLKELLRPILTTWDDEWAAYMADTVRDMKIDPRIPPLATDNALRTLSVRALVLGGDEDISFPGSPMAERVRVLVPNAEAEVLQHCRHCPPTTPEFRSWLADRVTTFLTGAN